MLSSREVSPTSSDSEPIHILAGEDPGLSAKPTSILTTTSIQALTPVSHSLPANPTASDTTPQLPNPHSVDSWLSVVVDNTFSDLPLTIMIPSKRSLITTHKPDFKRRRIQAPGVPSEAEAASVCSCNGQHPPTDEESDREGELPALPSVSHVSESVPDLDSGVGGKPVYDIARAGHETPHPKIPTSPASRHQRAKTL
jgi:hypothetical protein